MSTTYEKDLAAWAREQAALLIAGRFDEVDIAHVADEVLDIAKAEEHALERAVEAFLVKVLQWMYKPMLRCEAWRQDIVYLREVVERCFDDSPSLRACLEDPEFVEHMWMCSVAAVIADTGRDDLPQACPWSMADVLQPDWLPADSGIPPPSAIVA